jgi:hypothetical protein
MIPKRRSRVFILPASVIAAAVLELFASGSTAPTHKFKETVKNGLTPAKETEQILSLNQTLSIDMERPDITSSGMGVPGEFDADAEGNLFVVAFKNAENFVYKFDSAGKLIHTFGKYGQGPGELQWPFRPAIMKGTHLSVFDGQKKTFYVFDDQGRCLKEKHLSEASQVEPLANGNYLVKSFVDGLASKESYTMGLYLYDREFRKVKELDRRAYSLDSSRLTPFFMWRTTPNRIYVVNENRGYEIWVFDLDGNPVRKIVKDFKPVRVTDELIKLILGQDAIKNRALLGGFFPDPMPPMSQIFVDDEDRVFVITYERGESPGEYMIDVFDRDGILISRRNLNLLWARLYMGPHYTFAKNGNLYFYREKENGYNILFRHKMSWKPVAK